MSARFLSLGLPVPRPPPHLPKSGRLRPGFVKLSWGRGEVIGTILGPGDRMGAALRAGKVPEGLLSKYIEDLLCSLPGALGRDCDRALLLVGLVSRVGTHIVDTTIQTYTRRPIFQKGLASARGHTATGGWSRAGILLRGKQDQVGACLLQAGLRLRD